MCADIFQVDSHAQVVLIAEKHQKSAAQVLLRWSLQHHLIVVTKSENKQHIQQNLEILYFQLDDSDMQLLDSLDRGYRYMKGWVKDQWK